MVAVALATVAFELFRSLSSTFNCPPVAEVPNTSTSTRVKFWVVLKISPPLVVVEMDWEGTTCPTPGIVTPVATTSAAQYDVVELISGVSKTVPLPMGIVLVRLSYQKISVPVPLAVAPSVTEPPPQTEPPVVEVMSRAYAVQSMVVWKLKGPNQMLRSPGPQLDCTYRSYSVNIASPVRLCGLLVVATVVPVPGV